MSNFLKIREIYGLSQNDIAVEFGLAQQTYAKHETGKTKRIPYDFVTAFAAHYLVDKSWLLSGATTESTRKSVQFSMKLIKDTHEASKRLGVPTAFLGAVRDEEIVPSEEFLKNVNEKYLKAKEEVHIIDNESGEVHPVDEQEYPRIIFEQRAEIEGLVAENERLKNEVQALQSDITSQKQVINHLNDHISLLKEKAKGL